jgi:hypothetical protein
MRSWRSRKPFRAQAALFAVATIAVSVAARSEPQGSPTPLQLFQRMLPAMRHPRCTNCHGVVDPVTGKNHHGGVVPKGTDCTTSCHLAAEEWQIPGSDHFFAGRTDREICSQVSDFVSTFGRDPFRTKHIREDDQILQAFDGYAGGAREPGKTYADGTVGPPADKPPMSHAEFVKAGDDWILQGNAACDLEGTITEEEWVNSVDTIVNTPQHLHISTQTATRTVVVTATSKGFTADITLDGKITRVSTQQSTNAMGLPCTVVATIKKTYTGSTKGPAKVVMKDTAFMIPSPVPPQTDYRIDVELPKETTRSISSIEYQDGCGLGLKGEPTETTTEDFDEWTFTLEGRVQNAKENAVGGCAKTVKQDDVGETQPMSVMPCNRYGHMGNAVEPWLANHGAEVAFHTGAYVPFNVNVTWNLKRR